MTAVDVSVRLGPLQLASPIVASSGTANAGLGRWVDLRRLGALVTKSVTLRPRAGLPPPRTAETAGGMLNAIGLQNDGVDVFVTRDLPPLLDAGVPVIVSVAGETTAEYGKVARRLAGIGGVLAVEANISCPNVEDRGRVFACRTDATAEAVGEVAAAVDLPVLAKLTPDVADVTEIAAAARDAGAAGVTLINTLRGLAVDAESGRMRLAGITGGLSGPAIKPVALRVVHDVAAALPDLPIVGQGGVRTVEDVVEFVRAGAWAVGVGTGSLIDPTTTQRLLDDLPGWLAQRGHRRLTDLRGALYPAEPA